MGTDPSLRNHNPATFSSFPGTEKLENRDNADMLRMFNNNNYTDLRTANKHVLIPS